MATKKKPETWLSPSDARNMMYPGEPRKMLSPIDRRVLIALDGRMTEKEILDTSGISHIALILSVYRLVALGFIEQKSKRRGR